MVNGLALFILSIVDIYLDNRDVGGDDDDEEGAPPGQEAAAAQQTEEQPPAKKAGEGGEGEEEAGQEKTQAATQENTKSLWYQVKNCDGLQKNNFAMNFLVFFGQGQKYVYDSFAADKLNEIANATQFIDMSGLFIFNQVCMFTDSVVICLAALSLASLNRQSTLYKKQSFSSFLDMNCFGAKLMSISI